MTGTPEEIAEGLLAGVYARGGAIHSKLVVVIASALRSIEQETERKTAERCISLARRYCSVEAPTHAQLDAANSIVKAIRSTFSQRQETEASSPLRQGE